MRGMGGGFDRPLDRDGSVRASIEMKDVPFRRILKLFKPYRRMLIFILLMALTASVIGLAPPLIVGTIIDVALYNGDMPLLIKLVIAMITLPILSGLIGVLQNHLNTKVGQSIMRDLRQGLFRNLQQQSMSFFTHSRSGEIIQRLTGDVQMVQDIVNRLIVSAVTQSVVVISTVCILFYLDWRMALLALCVIPFFVLPVRKVARYRRQLRMESQRVRGQMSAQLGETFGISGALLTRIFTREPMQQERFGNLNEKVLNLELKVNLVGRWFNMALGLIGPLGLAVIYLYGGSRVIEETLTVGAIVAFTLYMNQLYGPVTQLLNLQVDTITAAAVFQRIFEYEDMKPDVADAPDAYPLPSVNGRISVDRVSYAYNEDQYALKDISFEVRPGELVALVGPSGAGKSTLIGMLARLYDPGSGRVEIDGHDVRRVQMASLRSQVGFVTQESFLFHATVRENLMFANELATEEELVEACRKAYILELIESLPEGFDTMVGERGHRLSGGERQRLAIARAILKDPRILVLDEATSHLDSESEAYVQAALEELMRGRTTLVIAHRLSTILAADKIIVMESGQIVEEGSHGELLKEDGLYARLYRTQFSRVKELDEAAS